MDPGRDGLGNFRNFKHRNVKDFDIVNNYYYEGHEEKVAREEEEGRARAVDKYWRTHDFNPLIGRFYDPDKEEQFLEAREQQAQAHGSTWANRLPQSYRMREQVVIDPSKDIPEQVRMLDLKRKNAKKRYEMRYLAEHEIKGREEVAAAKMEETIRSRLHPGKVVEDEAKTFNIISLEDRQSNLARPFPRSTWEKVQHTRQGPSSQGSSQGHRGLPALHWEKQSVKSGGFEED
jgi:hypothetical protein